MELSVLGIDLAKNIFELYGIDGRGQGVLSRRVRRQQLMSVVAQLPACRVVMEACGGAHYWAREFAPLGHEVMLLKARDVKPYRQGNKDDRHDAAALAEAGTRAHLRAVPVNGIEQQDLQSLHRAHGLLVKQRTALVNQVRGLLAEYGVVVAQGIRVLHKRLPEVLEDAENGLTAGFRETVSEMAERLRELERSVTHYKQRIKHAAQSDERCRRLLEVEGMGPMVTSALVSTVGDGRHFDRARAMSACLGMVPAHTGTGGKVRPLGVPKTRGNRYVRTLLIHGARSVVRHAAGKSDPRSRWVNALVARRGKNVAAVAVANQNVRIAWALLTRGESYRPGKGR